MLVRSLAAGAAQVALQLTADELELFRLTFAIADTDADEVVSAAEGRAFLRRSALPEHVLDDIWSLALKVSEDEACPDSKAGKAKSAAGIGMGAWLVTCKVVAMAQQDRSAADGAPAASSRSRGCATRLGMQSCPRCLIFPCPSRLFTLPRPRRRVSAASWRRRRRSAWSWWSR